MCCGKHKAAAKANGGKSSDFFIGPFEPCVFCAEKHISYAHELSIECGYDGVNRLIIIGELQAGIHHLWKENRALAEQVRAIRHQIQQRTDAPVDWHPILTALDFICTAEAQKGNAQ